MHAFLVVSRLDPILGALGPIAWLLFQRHPRSGTAASRHLLHMLPTLNLMLGRHGGVRIPHIHIRQVLNRGVVGVCDHNSVLIDVLAIGVYLQAIIHSLLIYV